MLLCWSIGNFPPPPSWEWDEIFSIKSLGRKVYYSVGSEKNVKLTTPEDIEIFKSLLHTRKEEWMKEGEVTLMNEKIDIVIPWVDGGDIEWQKERNKYAGKGPEDFAVYRYRDMGLLKYLFRGIEKNMPWVNKVFFVIQDEKQIPE